VPTGVLAEITPGNQTGVATGFIVGSNPGPVAIDGNNNIYQVDEPTTGRFYISELTQSSNYTTLNEGVGRATAIYNSVFIDDTFNQYMWAMYSATCTPPATIVRANSTYEASSATTANITDSTGCAYAGAADALGNAWVSATGNLYYLNVGASATATVTTVTGSVNTSATGNGGFAGLDNPGGIAIDGAGNVWALNAVTSTLVGLSEISTTTNNGVTTYAALSPGGSSATQAGIFGFQTDGASGAEGVQIDPSGNIWLDLKSGSYLYHMVGAAAPTVTPVAQNVALGSIGTRP
jgi:hypothetical protein